MRYLKTNTATRVTVGPFLDVTDGITPEVALTVTGDHLTLVVDDAGVPTLALDADATASAGNNDMVHVTNDDAGFYDLELTAAQLNYVGRAILAIIDTDVHLPVFHEFMILSANAYDWMFGTGNVNADAVAISGDTTAADNCELMFDGTGYAGGTAKLNVNTSTISNDAITAAAIATGAIDADAIADNAIDAGAIAADAITAAKIANGAIDNATLAADVGSTAFATNIIAQAVFKALDSAIGDAVSLTANGLLEKVRRLTWVLTNKIEVTDANGNTVVYKDDSTTPAYSVSAMLTDDSTTTTRLRAA